MNRRLALLLATSVGFSFATSRARASIVYVPVNPPAQLASIDFDGDGIPDVSFTASTVFQTNPAYFTKTVTMDLAPDGNVGNAFDANPYFMNVQSTAMPTTMTYGHTIGAADTFSTFNASSTPLSTYISQTGGTTFGPGNFPYPVTGDFIGLSVVLGDGQTHYAWISYDTNQVPGADVQTYSISGYAYETTPNVAIGVGAVPEPASMGAMMVGVAGMSLGRRRKCLPRLGKPSTLNFQHSRKKNASICFES